MARTTGRKRADPKVMPINLGTSGSWTSGDPTSIPDGYARSIRNMLLRPNRIAARPPFVYDNLMAISGLMRWEDLANQQTRFLALDTSRNLYMKAASGETWGGAITGTATASRITDYANYRGKVYYMLDDGAGTPVAAAMFDGTTITAAPFSSAILAKTITTFIDRLILGAPRVTVTPLGAIGFPLVFAYDWTSLIGTFTNVTRTLIDEGSGIKVMRLSPTSTAASACSAMVEQAVFSPTAYHRGIVPVVAAPTTTTKVWLFGSRGTDASFDVPVTLEFVLNFPVLRNVTYIVGQLVSNGNGFRYRCTTAGSAAAVDPGYSVVIGSTTTDGTAVFTCDGLDVLASLEDSILNITQGPAYANRYLSCVCPPSTADYRISPRIKFYNSMQLSLGTLASVDISYRDGLADGDSRKANFGQQITDGDFFFPFFNTEVASSATVSLSSWIWTETTQPKVIRAANSEEPQEAAGLPTAACVLSGRFIGFKRRAFWVFKGTSDPDNPLLPESPATMADGCLGPRAVAVIDDEAFFIGENEVYRFRVGGYPQPLCGDAMKETIMARGANWVENQATYNMPLIAIDRKYGELWVYTQKGTLFCYHMNDSTPASAASALITGSAGKGAWTTHDVAGTEVAAMAFNPITQEMEFSFGGHGLARLDPSVTAQDTIDNTGTLYSVTKDIILKPFELYSPRYELCLHDIGIYHLATYTQAGEALYAYVSFDRGGTYPKFNEVRFDTTNPRIPISIFQAGLSVQVKLSHVGSAGEAAWCVSRGEATMELMSGEWPLSRPAQIASNL